MAATRRLAPPGGHQNDVTRALREAISGLGGGRARLKVGARRRCERARIATCAGCTTIGRRGGRKAGCRAAPTSIRRSSAS